jgi:hypothetical protein
MGQVQCAAVLVPFDPASKIGEAWKPATTQNHGLVTLKAAAKPHKSEVLQSLFAFSV